MEITEYRKEILEEIKLAAEANTSDVYIEFIRYMSSVLQDIEEIEDFTECYFEVNGKSNKKIMIDGYHFDTIDKSCLIFISDFSNTDELNTITNTQIDKLYDRMKAFVEHSLNGYIQEKCEESNLGYAFAIDLKERINEISKFRFYILTDQVISNRIKRIEKEDINGKPVELNVWDMTRLLAVAQSNMEKENIEIDFVEMFGDGINCIKVGSCGGEEYEPYLAVISGDILAKLYIDYGSRLLEGNVRSFLSVKGKVNKAIRNTILNAPNMFFAYNNGIAATATSIEYVENNGIGKITKINDLQIINGGQTTASIANAVLNKESNVKDVYVPMKLSVVNREKALEMIPIISRCANSQNKVDEADFFSNHPYHIRMEEYSRKIFAPAVNGNQYQTVWFYERARGQHTQEQMKLTQGEKKKYLLKNPKNQVIKKVDLAKFINTYNGYPHIVSKGAQYNMRYFAEIIDKEWEKSDEQFNDVYYRNVISLAILFKETEKIVSEQEWYKAIKSYRANIVTYTISILAYIVKKQYENKRINLKLIWNKQCLYNELVEQLEITTREVYDFITRDDRLTLNVTEWCKKETCWERAIKENWTITEHFKKSLIDLQEEKSELEEGKKERKIINQLNLEMEVVNLGADYWKNVLAWANERKLLNPIEQDFLKVAANFDKTFRTPSNKQAKRILEIREKLYEEGLKKD